MGFELVSGKCGSQPLKYENPTDNRWANASASKGDYFFNSYILKDDVSNGTTGSGTALCKYADKTHAFTVTDATQISYIYSSSSNAVSVMDCETDGELFAKRKSYEGFEMQTVEITQDDLSWMIGRRVYMQISDEGQGDLDHLQLDNLQVVNAKEVGTCSFFSASDLTQRDMTKTSGYYRIKPDGYSGEAEMVFIDYDGTVSGISDPGPWIRIKYARDKYSESDPWTGQAGKNEPAYESGTAYSGDFEFGTEKWLDRLFAR